MESKLHLKLELDELKLHPEKHAVATKEPYSCYHVTECTCGFKEACDSSG